MKGNEDVRKEYNQEGFDQNVYGEYFNPYTDDYDPDYKPWEDTSYNEFVANEGTEVENTAELRKRRE